MTLSFPFEHLIATTQDWPSPGVLFRDISPLLAQRFPETIDALAGLLIEQDKNNLPPTGAPYFPSPSQGEGRVGDINAPHPNPLPVSPHYPPLSGGEVRGGGERGLSGIDAFAGVDARGFIFAAALAQKFGKNLVMIRKGGKLPPPSLRETCTLEYGTATFEMKPAVPVPPQPPLAGGKKKKDSPPSQGGVGEGQRPPRIIILDDVLATGGTLRAAADLCARAGYDVVGLATLINLAFLNDFEWRGLRVGAVIRYD
jgi:adenine phosphoribosyltransferase